MQKHTSVIAIMTGMAALSGCGGGSGDSSSAAPLIALAAGSELVALASPAPTPTPSPTPAPATGFVGTQLAKGLFGPLDIKSEGQGYDIKLKTKDDSDVYVTRNAIAVGGQSGWHTHPGPSLITVTLGEIVAYESDDPLCAPTHYTMGQGFVDTGDHAHLIRNESASPAETVAVQFLPKGAVRREGAPQPPNCSL
jgi:quercetin dioxygenase-like cupin family protein